MNSRRRGGWRRAGLIAPAMLLVLLIALAPVLGWLRQHPGANPWAQLEISQAPGWATKRKLAAMVGERQACIAMLDRSGVPYQALPPIGSGRCLASERIRLAGEGSRFVLSPAAVAPSCAVSAGLLIWMRHIVQPAAQRHFGQRVTMVESLGSYNCRGIDGRQSWSEHARSNAIDVSAFVLADGRRIVVRRDWAGRSGRATFLREVRDGACGLFTTVLSPDYNPVHHDHFHLDMAERVAGSSLCR